MPRPQLPEGWENDSGLPDQSAATEALAAAYPDPGPSVWKDPRICLLLPYWRAVLQAPMAAVLVWRAPLAVARSLRRRDGTPLPYGVALWERYNRSAIANLAGTDVYVLDVRRSGRRSGRLAPWTHLVARFDRHLRPDGSHGTTKAPCRSSPRIFATSRCRRRKARITSC